MKNNEKTRTISLLFFALLTLCFWGCKDDKADIKNHDSSKPIKITHISPENGTARTQLFIHGENFGTDESIISVKISNIDAKVVGSNGQTIYCIVPPKAYEGTIEVTIGKGMNKQVAVADQKFKYDLKRMVQTLCGYVAPDGSYKVEDGPFETVGFNELIWLTMDPKNHNHIYAIEHKASIRLIDLEKQKVSTVITNGQMNVARPRTLTWTPDGDGLLISNDQGSEEGISNVLLKRETNFKQATAVTWSRSCNGSTVHPVNGEYYFSQWEAGSIWRQDPNTGEARQELFRVWANGYEIYPIFHPTGNYAYLIITNNHSIVKSTYNWKEKKLDVPQPFVGYYGQSGWLDGVGINCRFTNPWQGVFVKNEEYVKQGLEDEYDFYVCDQHTGSIRKITPQGMVTTYAGRGSSGLDGNHWGYVDGDLRIEARFDQPQGIAYDEETKQFYIYDTINRRIRFIGLERQIDDTVK